MARKIPLIEFLKDRIYLGAYDYTPEDTDEFAHFTIDDSLPYNSFHHDFGPLHVGHLYRFAVTLHEMLADEDNEGKSIVLYSRTSPKARANAACVLCCYMVLIQSWPPHLALTPTAQANPPFMPFRDAGYAQSDFTITIQDVVYGVWRAKEQNLLDLKTFNLDEYELYERVDQGDFNELPPHFVAFASPQQHDYDAPLNYPFCQVLDYFEQNDVQLVVRLNSELYNKQEFENRGVRHMDLIFEDGTCPTMPFVQAFIGAAECVIAQGGKVAVHCKAGLGRTGCLIGAYLIYTYGFTAQEVIAYMRFMRPGMVVGPQQHWLYLHQNEFREWKRTMCVSKIADDSLGGFCPLVPITSEEAYSPSEIKVKKRQTPPRTPERSVLAEVDNSNSTLPVPTPGQPRKNSPSNGSPRRVVQDQRRTDTTGTKNGGTNSDDEEDDLEPENSLVLEKPKRNVTDSLSAKQQMIMGKQLRSASNPSPQRRPTSKNNNGYQMTTTTTTTTTTTVSASPEGKTLPRRSTRISSNNGVRKISGANKRK